MQKARSSSSSSSSSSASSASSGSSKGSPGMKKNKKDTGSIFQQWLKHKEQTSSSVETQTDPTPPDMASLSISDPAKTTIETQTSPNTLPPLQATTATQSTPTLTALAITKIVEIKADTLIVEDRGTRYEIARFCPHKKADLSTRSELEPGHIICTKHMYKFQLDTGTCISNSKGCILSTKRLDW